MKDILIPEKNEVKLPAKSSIDLALNLKMPSKFFPEILAGGITFQEKNSIADEKAISPDLKLGNVRAGQVNYRNKIFI